MISLSSLLPWKRHGEVDVERSGENSSEEFDEETKQAIRLKQQEAYELFHQRCGGKRMTANEFEQTYAEIYAEVLGINTYVDTDDKRHFVFTKINPKKPVDILVGGA